MQGCGGSDSAGGGDGVAAGGGDGVGTPGCVPLQAPVQSSSVSNALSFP